MGKTLPVKSGSTLKSMRKTVRSEATARTSGSFGCHLTECKASDMGDGATQRMRRPLEHCQRRAVCQSRSDLRNIVRDHLGQLPDNEATVRGHTSESVAVDSHVGDTRGLREERRKLKKSAVAAGPRDNTNTTWAK